MVTIETQTATAGASGADLRQSAERLLAEHEVLMQGLGCHQDWIHQLSEIGMPRFGELACRLDCFRAELARHFQNEEQYTELLHGTSNNAGGSDADRAAGGNSPASGSRLHAALLERLAGLSERLRKGLDEFAGWNDAVGEVGALVSEICEHERREMDVLRKVTGATIHQTGAGNNDNGIAQ